MINFPPNKFGMTLEHNPHLVYYQTVEEWIDENHVRDLFSWVSEEEKSNAIFTREIWTIQWYPDSPNGFIALVASSLPALLERANSVD